MQISFNSHNLLYKEGIYFSRNDKNISYPTEGNSICYQIEDKSFWFKHRNNCIIETIRNYPCKGTILDVGGGNGFVTKAIQEEFGNAVLIEPGLQGALNAQKRGVNNIICGTFQEIHLVENSVSGVGLFDVLEHIEDDIGFLKEIQEKIELNGKLYITVPAYSFLWSNEDKLAGHYRRYTLSKLKILLEETGFKIEYKSYFFSFLTLPIFFFRTLPSLVTKFKTTKRLDSIKTDHRTNKNFTTKLLNKILRWELKKIIINKRVYFGSSCIVVAKKA